MTFSSGTQAACHRGDRRLDQPPVHQPRCRLGKRYRRQPGRCFSGYDQRRLLRISAATPQAAFYLQLYGQNLTPQAPPPDVPEPGKIALLAGLLAPGSLALSVASQSSRLVPADEAMYASLRHLTKRKYMNSTSLSRTLGASLALAGSAPAAGRAKQAGTRHVAKQPSHATAKSGRKPTRTRRCRKKRSVVRAGQDGLGPCRPTRRYRPQTRSRLRKREAGEDER